MRLDTTTVRQQVLAFLATFRLAVEHPDADRGLITLGPDGVRANVDAFLWTLWQGAIPALELLLLLEVPLANADVVVAWAKRQQHPAGYFKRGVLGRTFREATYRACGLLKRLDAIHDPAGWDPASAIADCIAKTTHAQRMRPGGCFTACRCWRCSA